MERVPIQPQTLAWARQVSGLTVSELANAIGVKAKQIDAFETGTAKPTFKQLVNVAKKLDRTPAFFFTEPPAQADVPPTVDFRQSPEADGLDAATTKALRRAERYREIMLEYSQPSHAGITFPTAFHWGTEQQAAAAMRSLLELEPSFVPTGPTKDAGFKMWRDLLENHGIMVFQTSDVERGVFRGLSVYHDVLPIVLLNGKDSSAGKTFTLFHELGHLINRSSGLCLLEETDTEEALVNSFAAHFLMPGAAVSEKLSGLDSDDLVGVIATHFKVSRVAAAIRLKNLGVVNESAVKREMSLRNSAWKQERDQMKKKEAGPAYWRMRYRDLGATYVGTVARALEEEKISILDASYFLDSRVPTVDKLIDAYRSEAG